MKVIWNSLADEFKKVNTSIALDRQLRNGKITADVDCVGSV